MKYCMNNKLNYLQKWFNAHELTHLCGDEWIVCTCYCTVFIVCCNIIICMYSHLNLVLQCYFNLIGAGHVIL